MRQITAGVRPIFCIEGPLEKTNGGNRIQCMRRVNVVGNSGSGKTTLGKELASLMGCPFYEMDAFQHEPNWQIAPLENFREQVEEAVKEECWVMDGNYRKVRDLIWPHVDTVIWLDYPMLRCLGRVVRRTFRRWWRKEDLWHGNRERLFTQFFTGDSLFLWVIRTHARRKRQFTEAFASPELEGKRLLRFRSPTETARWLEGVRSQFRNDR